jgi:cellulose biosynthesis protein BcsQ
MKVLATYHLKGGVGKTATAVNLAYEASLDGQRVLVWDLDPQGAATYYFRVKPRVKGGGKALVRGTRALDDAIKGTDYDNLDLVPADFSYRNLDLVLDGTRKPTKRLAQLLKPLRAEYDVVVLDCPPSISLASESVFSAADALVVPLIPTTLSMRTYDQLQAFLADSELKAPELLAFFSMVDRRRTLHRDMVAELEAGRTDLLQARVPSTSDIERMGIHRAPVGAFAPRSRSARAYRELWAEVRDRLS